MPCRDDGWERFNDQFRETETERNDRLRKKRLAREEEQRAIALRRAETGGV